MRAYKIYVCVSLTLIVLLLGSLVGALVYGGMKIKKLDSTVTSDVSNVTAQANTINQNLKGINISIQNQKLTLPAGVSAY